MLAQTISAVLLLSLVAGCGGDPSEDDSSDGQAGDGDLGGGMAGSQGMDSADDRQGFEPVVEGADELPPDADHPYIQYFGRWNHEEPKSAVAGWGGVYVRVRFTGSSLTLRMVDEQLTVDNGVGTGNVYQYQIDDGDFVELSSSAGEEYELATALPEGEHSLLLVRRTESKFGTTTLRGFKLDEGARLLPPPGRPSRKIEIFGDSISAGLANENRGDYRNINENGYEAFGPQLARMLDAEWRVEARGGGSFLLNWLPMVPWFDKAYGPLDMQHQPDADALLWSFDTWQPDVFLLALGTNDSSEMYPAEDESAYVSKYQNFLKDLRRYYPQAEIFGIAPWKEGAPWDLVRSHIRIAMEGMDDPHMHAIIPLEGSSPDYTGHWLTYPDDYVSGDEYHPNIQGHTKIAAELAARIGPVMGWE